MHAVHSGKNVTNERYVPIHTIDEKLTEDMCGITPAVHALSFCYTNISLQRIGKRTVYDVITKTAKDLNYLVNYLVWPHQQDAHQRGLGLSGLIHEEAHPTASNFS